MLRKNSEFTKEIVANMAGGDGNVILRNAFSAEELTSKVCACCTVTLEKGCGVGLHQHTEDDEIYFIISGSGLYDDGDGNWTRVTPGDATKTGDGGWHAIKNDGEEPLVFLAVVISY